MNSNLFNCPGENQPQAQQQEPREVALSRMKSMGIDIPQGMENDPNALIQHVMQSGRVPTNRLNMAQQVMQRMFGRR